MTIEFKKQAFIEFCEQNLKDNTARLRSWDRCYLFFQELFKEERLTDSLLEQAEVELGFYLASFGMLRGSTQLFWKNSLVFGPIIEEFFSYVKTNNIVVDGSPLDQETIYQLSDLIRKGFKENDIIINEERTLFTKILMGVFACTPAFDTYFKKSVREFKKEHKDDSSVQRLGVELFCGNKEKDIETLEAWIAFVNRPEVKKFFKEASPKFHNSKKYPIMRTVDLYFWFLGL